MEGHDPAPRGEKQHHRHRKGDAYQFADPARTPCGKPPARPQHGGKHTGLTGQHESQDECEHPMRFRRRRHPATFCRPRRAEAASGVPGGRPMHEAAAQSPEGRNTLTMGRRSRRRL
jgi:hypothetical protein